MKGLNKMTKKLVVNDTFYRIILTDHIIKRMQERSINPAYIADGLNTYLASTNDKKHRYVMVEVAKKGISLLLNIRKNNIKLITVINKVNCYVKSDTIKVVI